MLSRGSASVDQSGARLRSKKLIAEIRHPQIAARARIVEQPHAAGVAFALLDQRLHEHAEEAGDVRLAHQQIERELHRVALNTRRALGEAPRVRFLSELLGERLERIARRGGRR